MLNTVLFHQLGAHAPHRKQEVFRVGRVGSGLLVSSPTESTWPGMPGHALVLTEQHSQGKRSMRQRGQHWPAGFGLKDPPKRHEVSVDGRTEEAGR